MIVIGAILLVSFPTNAFADTSARNSLMKPSSIEQQNNKDDSDGDWLTDEDEADYGTDIYNADSDGDGMSDFEEVFIFNTDPAVANADSDEDGFFDQVETTLLGTDPNIADADQDQDLIPDNLEQELGTDPAQIDTDDDLLSDFVELYWLDSDPLKVDEDSNQNGHPDIIESWVPSYQMNSCGGETTLQIDSLIIHDAKEADSYTNQTGGDELFLVYAIRTSDLSGENVKTTPRDWEGDGYAGDEIRAFKKIGPVPVKCGQVASIGIELGESDFLSAISLGKVLEHTPLLYDRLPLGWHLSNTNQNLFEGESSDGSYRFELNYTTEFQINSTPLIRKASAVPAAEIPNTALEKSSSSNVSKIMSTQSAFPKISAVKPIFLDDFSIYNGRWTDISSDNVTAHLSDEQYEVAITTGGYMAAQLAAVEADNFLLQVDTTQITDSKQGKTDVRFRVEDDQNYYEFSFGAEGYYQLFRSVNGDIEFLVEITFTEHLHVGPNAKNFVEVYADGSHIEIAVNEHILINLEDDTFDRGDIAIGATSLKNGTMKVSFSALQLWDLDRLQTRLQIEESSLYDLTLDEVIAAGSKHLHYGYIDDALLAFNYALEQDPESILGLIGRADANRLLQKYDDAQADIDKALAVDREEGAILVTQALLDIDQGNSEGAITKLQRIIKQFPDDSDLYRKLGTAYMSTEDVEQARTNLDRAVDLSPDSSLAHLALGEFYRSQADYPSAITSYSTALELDPQDFYAYIVRGVAYALHGDRTNALRDYNISISLNPDQADSYIQRGALFTVINNDTNISGISNKQFLDAAFYNFDRAIEIDDELPITYQLRALLWEGQGDYQLAIVDLNHALELDPYFADALFSRAEVYMQIFNNHNAYEDYKRYLQLDETQSNYANRACEQVNNLHSTLNPVESLVGLMLGVQAQPCQRFQ